MRFLHVNHRYVPFVGGSERYIQEVSETLAAEGHQVQVVTSDAFDLEYFWDASHRKVDAPCAETLAGVDVRRVPVKHFTASPLMFQVSRRLMGELSRVRVPSYAFQQVSRRLPYLPGFERCLEQAAPVDLVHATNIGLEGPALHARRAAARIGVPFVLTPFIHLGRTDDAIARRYVSMSHQRELMRTAQSIVVMTQTEASFVESLGVAAKNIHVTGVGVVPTEVTGGRPDRFRGKYGLKEGALVGVASAVAPDKGSTDLVLAVASLRERGHDVRLVLAGPVLGAFERWFSALDERAKDGIHLLGFISPGDKADMLAALDVLTMPSRTESFGIAYLEGWANAKPVLAARAGAVPELVRHDVNGLLVEFGDVDAIARGIEELVSDVGKARRLGEAGQALTLSTYTWPKVINRVRDAYSHALGYDIGKGV